MRTDEELIQKAKKGNEPALEELLRRYETRIFSYLFRMLQDQHAAEDAAQETFIRAIKGLKRYKEQGHFKAWLYQIAHRQGLKHIRSRKKPETIFSDLSDEDFEVADAKPLPIEKLLRGEAMMQIEAAIQKLPMAEREVLLLRVDGEMSFKEIAKITGCPINTALGRMRNASLRLRRGLENLI